MEGVTAGTAGETAESLQEVRRTAYETGKASMGMEAGVDCRKGTGSCGISVNGCLSGIGDDMGRGKDLSKERSDVRCGGKSGGSGEGSCRGVG